jgi:hypothetical protein
MAYKVDSLKIVLFKDGEERWRASDDDGDAGFGRTPNDAFIAYLKVAFCEDSVREPLKGRLRAFFCIPKKFR